MESQNPNRSLGREESDTPPPSKKGKSWFIGIGINKYLEFSNLNNAVKDVEDIKELLTTKYDISPENVTILIDEEANEENIIDQFDYLTEQVGEDDKLMIYYSGHGHLNKQTGLGYWIPYDAKKAKTARYIRNSTIRDYIKVIKAKHILLISDSCFSGSLFARGASRSSNALDELEAIPSRWAICSGRHDEEVYDGEPGKNSPFAESILDTLGTNTKRNINVAKLADRIIDQTRANYEQLPEGNPLYGVGHKGGQYVFHQKANEHEDWAACKATGTLAAYRFFFAKYPDGQFASEARANITYREEEEAWAKAKEANTIMSYYRYDQKYPKGRYSRQSLEATMILEEANAWRKALQRNTISGYRKYIMDYPKGNHVADAKANLEAIAAGKEMTPEFEPAKFVAPEPPKPSTPTPKTEKPDPPKIEKKYEIPSPKPKPESNTIAKYARWGIPALLILVLAIWGIPKLIPGESHEPAIEIFRDENTGKFGYMGVSGSPVKIPPEFDEAEPFKNGRARVAQAGVFFYIDENGKCIEDCPEEAKDEAAQLADQKAWIEALGQNNLNAYQAYQQQFPDGDYYEEAQKRIRVFEEEARKMAEANSDKKSWELAKQQNTISAFKAYCNKYPNGSYYASAQQEIRRLEKAQLVQREEEIWEEVRKRNTIEGFVAYQNRYPNGKYARDAEKMIRYLKEKDSKNQEEKLDRDAWEQLSKENSIEAYRKYLNLYPKGVFAKEAYAALEKLGNNYLDKRSGYKTINLSGLTLMAENLSLNTKGSICFDNNNSNCKNLGRLYTYAAARQACKELGDGWRLPTLRDWLVMARRIGGVVNGGSNDGIKAHEYLIKLGFDPLYGGKRLYFPDKKAYYFYDKGTVAYFWSSTQQKNNPGRAHMLVLRAKDRYGLMETASKEDYFSCRCIKD